MSSISYIGKWIDNLKKPFNILRGFPFDLVDDVSQINQIAQYATVQVPDKHVTKYFDYLKINRYK
jgi:hypothetical protein